MHSSFLFIVSTQLTPALISPPGLPTARKIPAIVRSVSRTSHHATVDCCKSFCVKQTADRCVVIERHLAKFEFGVHRNLETRKLL